MSVSWWTVVIAGVLFGFTPVFAEPAVSNQQSLVVLSPGVNLADAKAYATEHGKQLLSDSLELNRPGEESEQMLKKKIDRAQRAWLSGDVEAARADFRSVTELSLKADWQKNQREALLSAYMRLAQSSDSGSERDGWLEAAARLFNDLSPDAELFPPPLLNVYETVRKRNLATAVEINLADVVPDFRYVLIDGRKFVVATDTRVHITAGVHRITALSDSQEAVTEFLTGAQLRVLRLAPPALTDGLCETAQLRSRAEIPSHMDVEIYSGPACPTKVDHLLKNSRFISDSAAQEPPHPPQEAGLSSRTWIWIVGAAVVASAGYALATHSQSSTTATHRSGF